jgi:anhydro-N-acetylmuramic acid kinase
MVTAIGAISGTSMDGIDIALVETDGESVVRAGPGTMAPYPATLRAQLHEFLTDPARAETEPLVALEQAVTEAFTVAIADFMAREGIAPAQVDLIGLHGQTVWHRPEKRFTRQLGSGQAMAKALGIATVDGFRLADVASGGHGAPFAPLYHAALARALPQPLMVLNLGGVGNVTYIDGDTIIAFDTGPGSALIDDQMRTRFGLAYDADGQMARQGQVDAAVLADLLADPFFTAPAPKSLDRNAFHRRAGIVNQLADHDAIATVAAFTIRSVALALEHVPTAPALWLVGGGGRHNRFIMEGLSATLGVSVQPVEDMGWNGDLIEAQCFGYLAVRSMRGLPLSLPGTTGVPQPMPGGILWPVPDSTSEIHHSTRTKGWASMPFR